MNNPKKIKIIFHHLPPADAKMPSMAYSIMKPFLEASGYEVKVIYWNVIFSKLYSKIIIHGEDESFLLPFLWKEAKANNALEQIQKLLLLAGNYSSNPNLEAEYLDNLSNLIDKSIDDELGSINHDEVIIHGFSMKFEQWIPAMHISRTIKKKFGNSKIVIGGMSHSMYCEVFLNKFPQYDFAIYGEGEYPLLQLCESLTSNINDFANIPRLLYKDNSSNVVHANPFRSNFLELNKFKSDFTDYNDYAKQFNIKDIIYTINTVRSCFWSNCKFCSEYSGFKFRERDYEDVINELISINQKYSNPNVYFCDSDSIGKNVDNFEKFCDKLIDARIEHNLDFNIRISIIPVNMNKRIINKMSLAGFSNILVGYEAFSEDLLKNMNKKHSLSENFLFLKFSFNFNIDYLIPIIQDTLNEDWRVVSDSIANLKFIRFFCYKKKFEKIPLIIFYKTHYHKQLSNSGKEILDAYKYNNTYSLLPDDFIDFDERFYFFGFSKLPLTNDLMWRSFFQRTEEYITNKYEYKLIEIDDIVYYSEYRNNEKISSLIFDEKIYIVVLKFANDRLVSFDELFTDIQNQNIPITEKELKENLKELKDEYLVYYNEDLTKIISIIDTDQINK